MARIGFISEWQYAKLKNESAQPVNKRPYVANLSKNIISSDIHIVSPFEMDMILDRIAPRETHKYYVTHEYDEAPLSAWCEFFCKVTIPQLMKLVPENGTMRDVRVVYSFVNP